MIVLLLAVAGGMLPAQEGGTETAPAPERSSADRPTAEGIEILNEAIDRYEAGQFEQALVTFRELLARDDFQALHGDAYFWIARSAIALGRLNEAADNLEFFLANYPDNPYYVEGVYENGRLLHLQGDFEQSIQALERFIDRYPQSPFVANAYYWLGESLMSLGHYDRAEEAFRVVSERYPRSYRSEPARYRLSIIELRRREEELLKLLQWSHEEYVKAVEEFQEREDSYEAAIADYQRQIANDSELSLQSEVRRLNRQVQELQRRLQDTEEQLDDATSRVRTLRQELSRARSAVEESTGDDAPEAQRQPVAPAQTSQRRSYGSRGQELLAAKERALELQAFFVQQLLNLE